MRAQDRRYVYVNSEQEVLVNAGSPEQASCRPVVVMEVIQNLPEERKLTEPQ